MYRTNWNLRLTVLLALLAIFAFSCKKKTLKEDLVDPQIAMDSLAMVAAQDSLAAAKLMQEELLAAEEVARVALEAERIQAENKREQRSRDLAGLETIYFAFDKFNLSEEARNKLNRNTTILSRQEDARIRIEGHCDENGSLSYNLALGDRRAEATRSYLQNLGIDPGRFESISYGKSQPIVQGHDERAWSKNRRCEFKVLNP
jgi:peptidoglycan-associated lipoprotein